MPHAVGDLVCGRYEVRALVGRRQLSTVYQAFDREIGVDVALRVMLKELLPDEAARTAFVQKVARIREVAHVNLLRMYDVVTAGDEVVVAVQWAPGTTVRELLDRAKAGLPVEEVRQIVAALAAGLGYAHQRGLVLGDMRPETVMRVDDTVKLSIGVGLALPRRAYLEAMAGTRAREYMAPELRAGRLAEPRADVFSLAVLTAEMLSGELPSSGIRALSSLPTALGPVLSRALAEDPMLRPPNAEALARDIETALGGGPPERRKRVTRPPFDDPATLPEGPFSPSEEETRQVDSEELAAIQGSAVTRKVHEDEIYRLRVESGNTDELDVEMLIQSPPPSPREVQLEADYEAVVDTGPVFLLEPDAAKTEPHERLEPEPDEAELAPDPDLDDDALTNRVGKIDPDQTPLPPPIPAAAAKELGPSKLPALPTIEVSELPVEVLPPPPRPYFPPPPPPPAPSPISIDLAPVIASAPPPLPPPPGGPDAVLARRLRGGHSTDEVRVFALPPRRRWWPAALVVLAGVGLFTAVVMAVVAHMTSVRLEQQRLAAARLEAELRAQAEQLRQQRGVIASPSPTPEPSEPVPPVAAEEQGPCPLGSNLVEGKKPYCIDVYEYPGGKTIPRTEVTFEEAERLCQSRGQRLCTDHEFERACRGKGGASYPYGAGYDPTRCNTRGGDGEGDGEIARAGSFTSCRSSSGAYDLSGNVAEWVTSAHGPAQKGGSAATGNPQARCSNTVKNPEPGLFVGFRCCSDPR